MNVTNASGTRADRLERIASLDGIRAISIGLVLFGHLAGTRNFPVPYGVARFFDFGELGVRVFFVISGFLITGLLLGELQSRGRIDPLRFYFRRTFRIFPPYYAFLAVLGALAAAQLVTLAAGDLLHALTYTSNYHPGRSWNVGHTWSLGVEEQFYLLWPALLILLGRRAGLALAGAFVVAAPALRLAAWAFVPSLREGMGHRFEMAADSIALGCLLAGFDVALRERHLYRRMLQARLFFVVPLAVVTISALHDRPRVINVLSTAMNVGIALCIHRAVLYPRDAVGRARNSRPFVLVGVMSYSIYLWQQIFLNRASSSPWCAFPLNLVLVFAAAAVSYYVIERPALRSRQRLELWLFGRRTGSLARPMRVTPGLDVAPAVEPAPVTMKATTLPH